MYTRLTLIDELTRPDHHYLEPSDVCAYFGEYTARQGAKYSATNQLITNIKKPVSRRGQRDYHYKERDINIIVNDFCRIIGECPTATFIPVPPSKSKDHPDYDDRLVRILSGVKQRLPNFDFRELILQNTSTDAAHLTAEGASRPRPENIVPLYAIDINLSQNIRPTIVIFDDVLTTGAHFKAMQQVLATEFPLSTIYGVFIARRAPLTDDFSVFFSHE